MPSRIDIPLSGSAPGNGSAGLDGDVPRNAALAVRMLRYERVPVLDKQTGRPQEGPVMVGGKPLRNPDGSVRTGPVGTISGFYGETLCSHEKVFMRLSTDQEERADGSATGVSPNRHDLSVMVYAATPGIRRGRYGELVDIESLPDAEKPVMFCQRVVPLRDPRSGGPVLAGDGSLKCRAGWFTVLGNFKNEEGAEVRQLDHMTADRVSSVSMVLDAKWFAAVRESLRESCAAGIQSYGKAASLAARDVMEKFTGEAAKAAETDGSQPSSLGRLSVTSWYPERHIRVLNGEGKEEARRTLEAWLADPKFQKRLVQGPDGMPTERDSPVAPDMIVRLLNEKGEAAGAVRLSSWLLNRVAEAEAKGQNDPGAAMARLATPAGRAEWIMDILGKVSVTSGEKLAGFDVLTGESCRVSRSFTQPGAFGTGYGGRRVLHQTGELLYRALLHTHSPFPGQERQEITGGQYLVTRNQDDIVTGFHRLHDGRTSVPVTLMTGNGALPASAAFQEELDRERETLRSFPAGMQIMRPDGQRPDSGTEAAPETPGSPAPAPF